MICRSLGFVAWSAHSTQVRQKCIMLSFSTMVVAPNRPRRGRTEAGYPERLLLSQFNGRYRKLRRLGADQAKEKAPARTRAEGA